MEIVITIIVFCLLAILIISLLLQYLALYSEIDSLKKQLKTMEDQRETFNRLKNENIQGEIDL